VLAAMLADAISQSWMELSMFLAAAMIYFVVCYFVRSSASQPISKKSTENAKGIMGPMDPKLNADDDALASELRAQLARGDHRAAARMWKLATGSGCRPLGADLVAGFVVSMRKVSTPASGIVNQLSEAVNRNKELIASIVSLPEMLLRDDAVELVEGIAALLDEHGRPVESAIYAGIMAAHLRRKNFDAVAAVASRLPRNSLTPHMRATLAAAAAQSNCLDQALGHLRQMPCPADSTKGGLASSVAVRILALAAKERRVGAAVVELRRVHARIESRQLDDLLAAEGRRQGTHHSAVCKDLLEAASELQVEKGAGAYEALAREIVRAESDDPASDLLALLEELDVKSAKGGVVVGEPLALALFEACQAARDINLVQRTLKLHTTACAGAPGPRALGGVCSAFLGCGQPDLACDFYEKHMAPQKICPDAILVGLLAKAAVQSARPQLAESLFEIAAHASSQAASPKQGGATTGIGRGDDVNRQIAMMKQHGRDRELSKASNIFERVRSGGVPPTPMLYNCYLDVCVKCGDAGRALAVFDEMKGLKVVDVVGYNIVLKAHLGRGAYEAGHELLREMAANGFQANKVTFNELLHAKVTAGDSKGMWQLVAEMKAAGIPSNPVSCAIMLKSLTPRSSPSEVERTMLLIDEIEEPVDEVMFASVVEACMRIKQLGLLSDMMRRYKNKGKPVALTAPTYGSMIKAYGQVADVDRAWEVWNEMEERAVRPTPITIGCMVEALVTNGRAQMAWELIQTQLRSEERRGCINTVIYSTLLKGFALMKRIDRVFDVYEEMRGQDISCNTITYNTMLDACAKCGTMDRASALLVDMRTVNVEPDIITYSTIVKGYCLEGDIDRAFRVLEEMKTDDRFSPDEIMYNSLLDGCAKQQRVDDALRVLEEMQTAGVGPSNYTLSIMVKLLGRAKRLGHAFKIVEDLSVKHGFRPNVHVYTCLMQACVLNRRLERALALHDTVIADQSCKIDEKYYGVLARGCLQSQAPLKAAAVVRAAYQLPGHQPLSSTKVAERTNCQQGPVIGLERRALDDILSRLRGGGRDEQAEAKRLADELGQHRGISMGQSGGEGASQRPWRSAQRR